MRVIASRARARARAAVRSVVNDLFARARASRLEFTNYFLVHNYTWRCLALSSRALFNLPRQIPRDRSPRLAGGAAVHPSSPRIVEIVNRSERELDNFSLFARMIHRRERSMSTSGNSHPRIREAPSIRGLRKSVSQCFLCDSMRQRASSNTKKLTGWRHGRNISGRTPSAGVIRKSARYQLPCTSDWPEKPLCIRTRACT